MIIKWPTDDHYMIRFVCFYCLFVCFKQRLSSGNHLMTIWWSSNKHTNKAYHLVIIWWSFDDYLLIFWQQTNNQTIKAYKYLVIICLSFNDHILTMNKQTNTACHLVIIWWSFDDNLMIIWWSSIILKQTNIQII